MEQTRRASPRRDKPNATVCARPNLPRHLEQPSKDAAASRTPAPKPASEQARADAGRRRADARDRRRNVKEGELGTDPQLDRALELLKSWQVFKTFVARTRRLSAAGRSPARPDGAAHPQRHASSPRGIARRRSTAQFPATCLGRGRDLERARAASGHCYFTLKDDASQLARGDVPQRRAASCPSRPQTAWRCSSQARRRPLRRARRRCSSTSSAMEPRGLGALQLAFEQLKARLAAEGLFAPERKRPLPRFPRRRRHRRRRCTGAAIHDMRAVLRRRWPAARVVVRPVRVQGAGAGARHRGRRSPT